MPLETAPRILPIHSLFRPYRVTELEGVPEISAFFASQRDPFYVVDRRVATLHPDLFSAVSPDRIYLIDASEEAKSYERLAPLMTWLLQNRFRRHSHLVVVGGGVLQDIGGFVASILYRGVAWTLIPTTLLAQCDSCIGSKTSINLGSFKNQLGTFFPPDEVGLSPLFLKTLTDQEIRSGLGEALKLHWIESGQAWDGLLARLASGPRPASLRDVIWDSLRIKKRFIEEDERDTGIRNLLNFGHTFAHAIESATTYAIPHGVAVTMGLAGAAFFSRRLGWMEETMRQTLHSQLAPYFIPEIKLLEGVDPMAIQSAMRQDKKNRDDGITFILTQRPGFVEKQTLDLESQVKPWLHDYLAEIKSAGKN